MENVINSKLLANPMNWLMVIVILAFVIMLAFTFHTFSGIDLPDATAK